MADNALAFAESIGLKGRIVTSDFRIDYVGPAVGRRLIAWAHTVSHGRTHAVPRCDVFSVSDGEEKLCAVDQGTIADRSPFQ